MLTIILNRIKCTKCGDVLTSEHVYDFKTCKCRTVSVDGGRDYLKRLFVEESDYEDLSVYIDKDEEIDNV